MQQGPVLFYDGDCGFCNRAVNYVLKHDRSKSIRFTTLQSEFTKTLFAEKGWPEPDLSTFYFYDKDVLYKKSTAALHVANYFSFPRSLSKSGWVIPRFIRDGVYDTIAKRRRRISKGYCVMPTEEERRRFLR